MLAQADRLRGAKESLVHALREREIRGPDWTVRQAAALSATEPYVCELRYQRRADRLVTIEAGAGASTGYAFQVMLQDTAEAEERILLGPRRFSYAAHAVWYAAALLRGEGTG